MNGDDVRYFSLDELPAETVVPLTQLWDDNGTFADRGPEAFCSSCTKRSMRLLRTELWVVRHQPEVGGRSTTRFYCADHVPSREWVSRRSGERDATEVRCGDCGMLVRVGSLCEMTGSAHRVG